MIPLRKLMDHEKNKWYRHSCSLAMPRFGNRHHNYSCTQLLKRSKHAIKFTASHTGQKKDKIIRIHNAQQRKNKNCSATFVPKLHYLNLHFSRTLRDIFPHKKQQTWKEKNCDSNGSQTLVVGGKYKIVLQELCLKYYWGKREWQTTAFSRQFYTQYVDHPHRRCTDFISFITRTLSCCLALASLAIFCLF